MAGSTTLPAAPTTRAVRKRFFLSTLRQRWPLTLALVLCSVLLSAVPAIKSELESAVITAIDEGLREDSTARFRDLLDTPIDRLGAGADESGIEGFVLNGASLVFVDTPLWAAAASYVAIAIVAALLAWASTAARAELTRSFFTRLRGHGMRTLMNPSLGVLVPSSDREGHGTTVQQGALNVANGYSGGIQMVQFGLTLATTTWFVVGKNGRLAGAIWLVIVLQSLLMLWKTGRLAEQRELLESRRDEVVGKSDDIIDNRDVIAAHERRDHYERILDDLAGDYGASERTLTRKDQWYGSLSIVVADLGRMGILFAALAIAVGAYGSGVADIGDAYFLLAVYLRMLAPAQSLLQRFDDWRRSRDTSTRFRTLLVDPPAVQPTADEYPLPDTPPGTAIAFRDVIVDFQRPDGTTERALDHCTFALPAGQTSLIVGRSGSGKSTIARVLLGFLKPQHGRIVVRDRDVTAWDHEELMQEISYLAQGHHVIDDTVRGNLFCDCADDDQARLLASLHLPDAAATHQAALELLEKQAKKLSMGEQQRVAFARVLLDDDPIVLMDEPLAGVDAFTFRDVRPHFSRLFNDESRTVVLISHRLAFAADVDHVVVLEKGSVLEEGSRDELLRRNEVFAELYDAAYHELVRHAPAG